jgi:hypothetical protein
MNTSMQTEVAKLLAENRFCYFVPVDGRIDGCGFRASIVIENTAGHFPTGVWPFDGRHGQTRPLFFGPLLEDAQRAVAELNLKLGLTTQDVLKIVTSSMFPKRRRRSPR